MAQRALGGSAFDQAGPHHCDPLIERRLPRLEELAGLATFEASRTLATFEGRPGEIAWCDGRHFTCS
ncbi:MAG: hypothetical protein M3355_07445 [Actinomycetota bacterium]|nr:hypothetical protein [Actinomycetota bacterium]